MRFPSKGGTEHRLSVRIPWLIEIEGEGLVAVIGGIGLVVLIITFRYLTH